MTTVQTPEVFLEVDDRDGLLLHPSQSVMARTLLERGDPEFMFDAELLIVKQNSVWMVKS